MHGIEIYPETRYFGNRGIRGRRISTTIIPMTCIEDLLGLVTITLAPFVEKLRSSSNLAVGRYGCATNEEKKKALKDISKFTCSSPGSGGPSVKTPQESVQIASKKKIQIRLVPR